MIAWTIVSLGEVSSGLSKGSILFSVLIEYLDEDVSVPIHFENGSKPRTAGLVIRNMVIAIELPEVCSPALLLSNCVTLDKSFHLSKPQFPHL